MDKLDLISNKDCEFLLEQVTNSKDVTLESYHFERLADTPVGFLGDHFRLVLNTSENVSINFFVKTMPTVKLHANYIDEIGAFKKEVDLFQTLIPELQKIMVYQWSPKCYLSRDSVIVLEDLSVKNYRLSLGRGLLDLDHCIFAMKTLANMHATSIIWEHKNKAIIGEKFSYPLREAVYVNEPGHPRSKWLSSATNALTFLCEKINRHEDSKYLPSIIIEGIKNTKQMPGMCNVFSHGDLWSNNLMFSYDENDKIVNCAIVDFQLARYAPNVVDLMSVLHLITTKSMRDKEFQYLVTVYQQELLEILKNAEIILSNHNIFEDCQKYKQFALIEACLYGITIWLPSDAVGELLGSPSKCYQLIFGDRTSIMDKAFTDAFFRTQMTDLLNELLDTHTKTH